MIFSGLEFTGEKPFSDVIIHPTILTKDGKRMSKSLGTGIDPIELIEKYGADATRFGLIWQMMKNQDIHWDETAAVAGKKFANKIWNAARFVLANIQNTELKIKKITPADKKIFAQLQKTKKSVEKNIENFHFGKALRDFYDFFWRQFCDVYLEKSKKQMADGELKENTQKILSFILFESLKLLHPFMPFITEEIWQSLPDGGENKMLITEKW